MKIKPYRLYSQRFPVFFASGDPKSPSWGVAPLQRNQERTLEGHIFRNIEKTSHKNRYRIKKKTRSFAVQSPQLAIYRCGQADCSNYIWTLFWLRIEPLDPRAWVCCNPLPDRLPPRGSPKIFGELGWMVLILNFSFHLYCISNRCFIFAHQVRGSYKCNDTVRSCLSS